MTSTELSTFRKRLTDTEYYQNRLSKLRAAMGKSINSTEQVTTEEDRLVYCGQAESFEKNYAQTLQQCQKELARIETYIHSVSDPFVKLLIDLHFIQGLSWQQCAVRTSPYLSADAVRMKCKRYLDKHPE